jgi:hypothetical protein
VLLLDATVVGALASFRAFAFQAELVISSSEPAATILAGHSEAPVLIVSDLWTLGSAAVALTYRSRASS